MRKMAREVGRVERYRIALLAVLIAFVATYATWPLLKATPWALFFAGTMVSAWYGGWRTSLAAMAVMALLGQYFFFEPYGSFLLNRTSIIPTLVFIGVSLFIGLLASARRRAEAYERVERKRFQATVESIGDAVIATDAEGRVTYMNVVAEGLTGWSVHEASSRKLEDVFVIVNEDTRQPIQNPVKKVLETGRIQGLANHTVLISRDGSERPIDDSAALIRTDLGEIAGVVLVFHDITEKNLAAKALAESNERYRTLFSSMVEGFCVIEMFFDDEGRPVDYRFLVLNPAFELHTGLKDALGKTMRELAPDHDAHWFEIYGKVAKTGEAVRFENEATALGGRWFDVSAYRLGGAESCKVAILFMDITERKRAEEAKEQRARQLQLLAEIATRINSAHDVNSVLGVVTEEARNLIGARKAATSMVLDPNHPQPINVISTPASRPFIPASVGFDATTLHDAVNEEFQPIRLAQSDLGIDPRWKMLERVALVVPTEGGWLAAQLVGRNGRRMGLLQLADKMDGEFTEDDEAVLVQLSRLAAIAVENARLYEELRDNDQRKDEFLAMLAHELRNPLAAIGNAIGVTTRSGLKEDVGWAMDIITRQMRHLTRLIDDLLDVSRISRGKIELRRDLLDATPILDSAVATVKPLIDEREHELDASIDRGNLWVNVDPTRLEQVVVNLLSNAAKYSENGGAITLSAGKDGGDIVISVRDWGVGIPPERVSEMFELFAQGDRSLARSEGGLGIGLTVVKKLVEMHGGTISARSEGPGTGSVFTIRLPAAERPEAGPASAPVLIGEHDRKARILVVDDNANTADGIARLLKLIGHEVATAHGGHEALEVARDFNPEFILLDIGLPGMDGYEVASRLRREECCKDVLIVAVSGYGQDEDRRRSKEAGFDYHLIKPLDHEALLALLSQRASGRG